MSKRQVIFLLVLFVFTAAWFLITPAFRVVELDEPSPLGDGKYHEPVDDMLAMMSPEKLSQFVNETNAMRSNVVTMSDTMPNVGRVTAQAAFKPRAHEVAGQVKFIETPQGNILRFENFDTINGPDLRIYASATLGANDFVDLGPIRATRGNANYVVPEGVDIKGEYNKILVWCRAFGVLFSYAELQ